MSDSEESKSRSVLGVVLVIVTGVIQILLTIVNIFFWRTLDAYDKQFAEIYTHRTARSAQLDSELTELRASISARSERIAVLEAILPEIKNQLSDMRNDYRNLNAKLDGWFETPRNQNQTRGK